MPTIYQFGRLPEARSDGFTYFSHTVSGTVESVSRTFAGQDVAIVMGAEYFGRPGEYQFGVMSRTPAKVRPTSGRKVSTAIQFAYTSGSSEPLALVVANRANGLCYFAGASTGHRTPESVWHQLSGLLEARGQTKAGVVQAVSLGFHIGRQRWFVAREQSGDELQPYTEYAANELHLALKEFSAYTQLKTPRVTIAWVSTNVLENRLTHYDCGTRSDADVQPWAVEPGHTYTIKIGADRREPIHVRANNGLVQWAFACAPDSWAPINTFPAATDYGLIFMRDGQVMWNAHAEGQGFKAYAAASSTPKTPQEPIRTRPRM